MADAGSVGRRNALTGLPNPVVGWRYWLFDPVAARLHSVSHRQVEWPVGRPLRAACVAGRHPAPAPGCNCGVYAAQDLNQLRKRPLCLPPDILVVGTVALGGRVLSEAESHRGERAYPLTLSLVHESVEDAELETILGPLARYGVPVGTVHADDVLGSVAAAQIAYQKMARRSFG